MRFTTKRKEGIKIRHLEIPDKVLKDKHIKPEGKLIYSYIFANGFDKSILHINVGQLQQVCRIGNKGLRKNLEKLEKNNYLKYKEYQAGMYIITLL